MLMVKTNSQLHSLTSVSPTVKRQCNLCQMSFRPEFKFQLFCKKCRVRDDSFMFHEWLPRIPQTARLSVNG